MIAKAFLAITIGIVAIAFAQAEYDVAAFCNRVPSGTKLPSSTSCQKYYICQKNGQVTEAACSNGTAFSKNDQVCMPEAKSNCIFGISNPCRNKHSQFAACSKGCNWYNWCVNGEIAANYTCKTGEIFNAQTQSCINGACNNIGARTIKNICEVVPNGQYFGDLTDCSAWYECRGNRLRQGVCKYPLVLDVNEGKCLVNKGDICKRTKNIATLHESGPPKTPCTGAEQVVADLNMCSTYYTCKLSSNSRNAGYQWVRHTCKNQYFDVITKTCRSTSQAKVFPGCNRCQFSIGRKTTFLNAVEPSCSQYLTCKYGQEVAAARSCGLGNFFNEVLQSCMQGSFALNKYIANHGACEKYSCNEDRQCSLANAVPPQNAESTSTATNNKNDDKENEKKKEEKVDGQTEEKKEDEKKPEEKATAQPIERTES